MNFQNTTTSTSIRSWAPTPFSVEIMGKEATETTYICHQSANIAQLVERKTLSTSYEKHSA